MKYVYNNKINKIILNDPIQFVSDWEPSQNMRLERRLITHIFLTEGGVRKLNI